MAESDLELMAKEYAKTTDHLRIPVPHPKTLIADHVVLYFVVVHVLWNSKPFYPTPHGNRLVGVSCIDPN